MQHKDFPTTKLERLPDKPGIPLMDRILPLLAMISILLVCLAMPNLFRAESIWDYGKCLLIGLSAGLVSYGINRLAIDRGTIQAAIGTPGATSLSLSTILFVGFGLFGVTFAGLTLPQTDQLRIQAFARVQAAHVTSANDIAQQSARIIPAIQAVTDDLTAKEACEIATSCVSGASATGVGSVSRAISSEVQRARVILDQVRSGADAMRASQDRLTQLNGQFQQIAADDSLSVAARRAEAQNIAQELQQARATLVEATPVALVEAYAQSLKQGVSIPNRPTASANLSNILRQHGLALEAVTASANGTVGPSPTFPASAGVSDTFAHILHFLPIALIIAVIEMVFPVTLWLYNYFALRAEVERNGPNLKAPSKRPSARARGDRKEV